MTLVTVDRPVARAAHRSQIAVTLQIASMVQIVAVSVGAAPLVQKVVDGASRAVVVAGRAFVQWSCVQRGPTQRCIRAQVVALVAGEVGLP